MNRSVYTDYLIESYCKIAAASFEARCSIYTCSIFNCVYICAPGHLEVVKLLVSQGSDKSCKDKRGYTPLHAAAASGHVDVVKYLLRNGAEVSKMILTHMGCTAR